MYSTASFLVPVEVIHSSNSGWGVHAAAPIRKGAVVWRFHEEHARGHDRASFEAILAERVGAERVRRIFWGGYWDEDIEMYVECLGGGHLLNHADAGVANLGESDGGAGRLEDAHLCASRDILSGEHLLENYADFCSAKYPDWLSSLFRAHCPERMTFELTILSRQQSLLGRCSVNNRAR